MIRRTPNFRLRADPKKLQAAALEVISSVGFKRARLEDIARQIGVTKGAIYMHFASKEQLLDRVIETFCLPDIPAHAGPPERMLETALGEASAAKVLKIVVSEWVELPDLGTRYLDAMVGKLCRWPGFKDAVEARELAEKILAGTLFSMLFMPGRFSPVPVSQDVRAIGA